jgi:thioredoxin reductase (NADPH)
MGKSDSSDIVDILFLGAGPTGLFGAFYAGMREMTHKVVDALPEPGGQITALYPEKVIYDTPGFPAIVGRELVENLVRQSAQWGGAMCLGERALNLYRQPIAGEPGDGLWVVDTDKGSHPARAVIIAAGIGAFEPVRLKNESLDQFEGKGVVYGMVRPSEFAGKRVLVVGGGDSAVDWALATEPIAERVMLIHRRDAFRAHESSVKALVESHADVRLFYELKTVEGDGRVERAIIFDNRTQGEEVVDVDAVILSLGFKADLGPIREWGLETVGRRYIKVNERMETNLPGVYAAGDVALPEGLDPLNLIVVGYGQVTVAVNYAYTYINPGAKVFPGHSSEKMAGKEIGR